MGDGTTGDLRTRVLGAAAAWTWIPYDAVVAENDEVTLTIVGETATVQRAEGDDPQRLIVAALRLANPRGATLVRWAVHPGTEPAGLADALTRHGSVVVEELDISAYDLGQGLPELPVPADVTIERVDTPEQLEEVYPVSAGAFDQPVASPEFRAAERATLFAAGNPAVRYLARVDGQVVGSAGVTVEGDVAKLWGGGVLAAYRGRGVYRALLAARLETAVAQGATFALVKARTGTSSPILRKAGFIAYGQEFHHEIPVRRAQPGHYATLPAKITGAGALFFDELGRVLIVEPVYKDHWEIPGGVAETNEPPAVAAHREVLEELGLDREIGRLLVVDWSPPRGSRPMDILAFVFDGGELSRDDIDRIRLQTEELRGYRFCVVDDTINETAGLLPPILTKRVAAAVRARAAGMTAYLERGEPR
ncbi:MAG: GNAT family N-acetyltransferase [Catenulispora sp.]|nr:GNAT family N-acetyltransferase [Catenulispora sp.]